MHVCAHPPLQHEVFMILLLLMDLSKPQYVSPITVTESGPRKDTYKDSFTVEQCTEFDKVCRIKKYYKSYCTFKAFIMSYHTNCLKFYYYHLD